MKQVVRRGLKEVAIEEVPDPTAPAHHVLLRTHYSLISSGTETASIHTGGVLREVARKPSHLRTVWDAVQEHGVVRTAGEVLAKFSELEVLGYSGAGEVLEVHPTVSDLSVGARIAYGGEGTGHAETVATGRNLVARVPDAVPLDEACFSTLGAIALNSVRNADISLGDVVAVIGLGLVGQLVAQLARLQGARVIGIDLIQARIDKALELGTDHGIKAGPATEENLAELTNGLGADRVMIAAAAKSAVPCHQALAICRDRGRIVVVGAVQLEFPWEEMYLKEIQLLMSRAYGPGSYDPDYERQGRDYPISYVRWTENRNMEEFLRLIEAGRVRVTPLISHRFAFEQAPEAFETIMDSASQSLAVVLKYPQASESSLETVREHEVHLRKPPDASSRGTGIGLIGSGNLARWHHLRNVKSISHCRLIGIHSASPVRGKSYAKRFGAEFCTTDEQSLLDDPRIHAILITSRNQHHARQALSALRAGKHVFVEKPMALTREDCLELCHVSEQSGLVLTVGFNRRFAPVYAAMKRQLEGRSGAVVINCRVNSPGISGDYWMADPAIGGAILGEACHFADLLYWLLESEPVLVSALTLPAEKREPVGQNNLVAAFEFADGSVANINYTTVGSKGGGGERVEVFAQGLSLVTENFKRLRIDTGVPRHSRRLRAEKGYRAQMVNFFEAIRTGTAPDVTARDGARATITCLQMLRSAATRLPCRIDLSELGG